jgi:hypothetical protein
MWKNSKNICKSPDNYLEPRKISAGIPTIVWKQEKNQRESRHLFGNKINLSGNPDNCLETRKKSAGVPEV